MHVQTHDYEPTDVHGRVLMRTCTNGRSRVTETHMHLWTRLLGYGHDCSRADTHASVRTRTRVYGHVCARVYGHTHAYKHACTCTNMHARVRTRTHAYGHPRARTDTYARVWTWAHPQMMLYHRLSLGLAFRIAPRLALDERICKIYLPSHLHLLYLFQAHLYASTCQT